jgi:hypothetical protein
MTAISIPGPDSAFLLARIRVEPETACWLWIGCLDRHGYGFFNRHRRMNLAHRYVYKACVGPIPEGLVLDHLCRVHNCVNPVHLEPVTCRENVMRGPTSLLAIAAAKTQCKRGHALDGIQMSRGRPTRYCKTCARMRSRARATSATGELRYAGGRLP